MKYRMLELPAAELERLAASLPQRADEVAPSRVREIDAMFRDLAPLVRWGIVIQLPADAREGP